MTGFGVALAKDVMVPMRDGIRLATDLYRPARDGELVEGRYPTILCRTPYDKTDKRYSEIADFFVPHGYSVCLQDCRDRYRSEGTREYFHAATPHEGEDGYDTVEWIAEQRWSNGRVGTVGSSFAGITQVRMALERPPHLTAIWPDVVPTNSFQHQSREGGAMQLHMFWALFIHAQDAQDIADDPEKQAEVWADLTRLRELFWETPVPRGPDLAAARADAREVPARLLHARQLRRALVAEGVRLHAPTGTSTPTSPGRTRPAGTTASPTPTPSTSRRWRRRTRRRSGWSSGRGATSACAATRPTRSTSTSAPDSAWGVQRYFAEQLAFFDRWLKEDGGGAPADEAPVRIFVMGGGSGRKTALGKLDHGGRWREEHEWPLARAQETVYHLRADGSLSLEAPAGDGGAAPLHLRPGAPGADDRRQLLLGRRAAGGGRRDGAGVVALPQPGAAAAQHPHPRAGRPEGDAGVLRRARALSAALGARRRARLRDRAARGAGRGDGPRARRPCGSRRAPSTPTSPRSSSTSTRRTRTIRTATTC